MDRTLAERLREPIGASEVVFNADLNEIREEIVILEGIEWSLMNFAVFRVEEVDLMR